MAHLQFNWLLSGMKGRACRHDEVYTKTNNQTGKSYAVKLCNPSTAAPSTAQLAQRTKFGDIATAVSNWMNTEKTGNGGLGSTAYLKALAAFKGQHQIGSLRGYIIKKYVSYDAATRQVSIDVSGSGEGASSGGSDI